MFVYAGKWFPGREQDAECLAEAAFLEWDYWEKQKVSVINALAHVFKKG